MRINIKQISGKKERKSFDRYEPKFTDKDCVGEEMSVLSLKL